MANQQIAKHASVAANTVKLTKRHDKIACFFID